MTVSLYQAPLSLRATPILRGYQIFHNYIKEYEGSKGETPAQAFGIAIEGKNKGITLIQNASACLRARATVENLKYFNNIYNFGV